MSGSVVQLYAQGIGQDEKHKCMQNCMEDGWTLHNYE